MRCTRTAETLRVSVPSLLSAAGERKCWRAALQAQRQAVIQEVCRRSWHHTKRTMSPHSLLDAPGACNQMSMPPSNALQPTAILGRSIAADERRQVASQMQSGTVVDFTSLGCCSASVASCGQHYLRDCNAMESYALDTG